MSPVTHVLLSWSFSSIFPFERRDRVLVTLAGSIPDVDGIGLLWDLLSFRSGQPLELWLRFHHVLGHNCAFGLIVVLLTLCLATRKLAAGVAAFLVFHLHLLGDIIGSRGPDDAWSVPYLLPFSHAWNLVWAGQWPLNSWQNFVITAGALGFVFYQAWSRGISPLELVSSRANESFVAALRNRFGLPSSGTSAGLTPGG
ncbi:MAG: hypothetical protein PHO83_15805 [Geobacteraceae bacterium]|nr:hypothetical protein [Geobacteraceae bacterium]